MEEVAPTAETFGAAGFFGVVMYYRGAAAADFVPLCPVVVRPQHWVSETVDRRLLDEERRRRSTRRRLGMALQSFHANNLARLHRVSGKSGSSGTPQCLCSFIRPDV